MHIDQKMYVRENVVKLLVADHHRGFTELAVDWEAHASKTQRFPPHRSQVTLWRWVSNGIPVKAKTFESHTGSSIDLSIFALASLLKVDPISLFDFERNGYFSNFQMFKHFTYEDSLIAQWGWPIWRMFIPQENWPDETIAEIFYHQPWHTQSLDVGDAETQKDPLCFSIGLPDREKGHPVAIHVGHRRQNSRDKDWRYFGSIVIDDNKADLYDERGNHSSVELTNRKSLPLGLNNQARPTEWMIACLHPFTVSDGLDENNQLIFGW